MKTRALRWIRRLKLAVLAAAALVAPAMSSCGGGSTGSGGAGGTGPGGSVQSSSSSSPSSSSSVQSSSSSSQSSAASSSQGSSSSGGMCPSPIADTCPGEMYGVSLNQMQLVIPGTTYSCGSNYAGYCGIGDKGSGPDLVYAIQPDADGTMHVELATDPPPWTGVVYAYAPDGCDKPNQVIACKDAKYGATKFALKVTKGKVYPIVVDGRDGESGSFKLTVTLADPTCGDGVIDQGEACDFGAQSSPAEGCDMCKFIGPPLGDTTDSCPAPGVSGVTAVVPVSISGFTSGYTDDYQPCGAMVGGPDRIFGFSPASPGTLTVTAKANFDVVLAAYTTCKPTLDGLLACSDKQTPNSQDPLLPQEQLSLAGNAGDIFYVVVDGYDKMSFGSFTLTATLK